MSNFDEFCEKNGIQCGYARAGAKQAWNEQQKKIDALELGVAEMKSRLNDAYTAGQTSMINLRKEKIDAAIKALEQSKPNMMCSTDALQALSILKGKEFIK